MPTTIHIPRSASPYGSRVPIGLNGRVTYIPAGEDYLASDAEVAALQALNIQIQMTDVPPGFILLSQRLYGSRVGVSINGQTQYLLTGVPIAVTDAQQAALTAAGRAFRGGLAGFSLLPSIVGTPRVNQAMSFSDGIAPVGFLISKRELIDSATGLALASATAPTALAYTPTLGDQGKSVFLRVTVGLLGVVITASSSLVVIAEALPILPATQAIQFGELDRAGAAGHDMAYTGDKSGAGAGWTITGTNAAHWVIDDQCMIVPAGTYGLAPTAARAGPYTLTVTAPGGAQTVITIPILAKTVMFRDKIGTNADTAGSSQYATALRTVSARDHRVVARNGAVVGGNNNENWNLRRPAVLGGFTGENHIVVEPETPYGARFRGIQTLDGQRNTTGTQRFEGWRWQKFIFDQRGTNNIQTGNLSFFGNSAGGATSIDLWDNRFIGLPETDDPYGSKTFNGIYAGFDVQNWRVRRNEFVDLAKGVYLIMRPAILDANGNSLPTGQADYHVSAGVKNEITFNTFRGIAYDEIALPNSTGAIVEDNFFYDKRTGVIPYDLLTTAQKAAPTVSPFHSGFQPHGDGIQLDYSGCLFGRVDGGSIQRNHWVRGQGRDTLPFFVSPPYSNPSGISGGRTIIPDPSLAYPDSQGIFYTNNGPEKAARGGTEAPGDTSGYATVYVAPVIRWNTFLRTLTNGLTLFDAVDAIIEYNTIIAEKSVPNALGVESAGTMNVGRMLGNSRIRYNVTRKLTVSESPVAVVSDNVIVSYGAPVAGQSAYDEVFKAPVYGPAVTSREILAAAFSAKAGGPTASGIGAFNVSGGYTGA